jgi:hypothetical protein
MLEALGNLGDFIGGLAVIATLLYLAVQVRQNTQMLRANALATGSEARLSFNHLLGTNPAAARVYQLGLEDFSSLTEDEQRQFLHLIRAGFGSYQHVFQQYEGGLVDEAVWHQDRRAAIGLLSLPHIQVWWKHRRSAFIEAFAQAIDQSPQTEPHSMSGDVIREMVAKQRELDQ